MIKRLLIALLLLSAVLAACSPARSSAPSSAPQTGGVAAPDIAAESPGKFASANVADVTVSNQADRLVIKNATLNIAVLNPLEAVDAVGKMAAEMGGFVVSSNVYKTATENGLELPEASIVIRVPAARLDEALDRIKALVVDKDSDILTENVTGQDVTKDYTDLQSRLTNLLNTEKQLQSIMDRATKTEDVLAVYNQLVSIREQIEVLKGQIQYYEESAALSMISVTIQSKAAIEPLSIGNWKPVGVARNALQATINGLKFLGNAAIWIILFVVPIGLVIFLPIRLVWVLIRRARKNRKPAAVVPPPANPEA